VPLRDLATDARFAKYQEPEAELIRPRTDRRPESWRPVAGSIRVGRRLGTDGAWADRRELSKLYHADMCDLVDANRTGSGPGTKSLAVVGPADPPELLITERHADQLAEWRRRAEGAKNRMSLFEDPNSSKPDSQVVPWQVQLPLPPAHARTTKVIPRRSSRPSSSRATTESGSNRSGSIHEGRGDDQTRTNAGRVSGRPQLGSQSTPARELCTLS